MKIHLVSDLHLEFGPYLHKAPKGTDVVIAAGDISTGHNGPVQLREIFGPHIPIIYIAGNHEFYGTVWDNCVNDIRQKALDNRVHYLHEGEAIVIDGVTFCGGTLWTNYELYDNREGSMRSAMRYINDFRRIGKRCGTETGDITQLRPQDTLKMHQRTIGNIEACARRTGGKLVIVSHMAPHPKSIHKKYSGDEVNPYYASDLTNLINKIKPDLWVHGHMHDSFDYMVGDTRIVCNPRGYVTGGYHSPNVLDTSKYENQAFNPNLLIEV